VRLVTAAPPRASFTAFVDDSRRRLLLLCLRGNPPLRLLLFRDTSDARIASHPESDPVFSESDEAPLLSLRRELLREGCVPTVTFSVTGADMDVGPVAVMSAGSVWGGVGLLWHFTIWKKFWPGELAGTPLL